MPFISDGEYQQFQQWKGGGAAQPAQQQASQDAARTADAQQLQQQYNASAVAGPGNAGMTNAGSVLRSAFQAQQGAPSPEAAAPASGTNEVAQMDAASANAADTQAQQQAQTQAAAAPSSPEATAPAPAPTPTPQAPAAHGGMFGGGFLNRAIGSVRSAAENGLAAASSAPPPAPAPTAPAAPAPAAHGGMFGRMIGNMRSAAANGAAAASAPPPAPTPAAQTGGGGPFGLLRSLAMKKAAAPSMPSTSGRVGGIMGALRNAAPGAFTPPAASPAGPAANAASSALRKNALTRAVGMGRRFF